MLKAFKTEIAPTREQKEKIIRSIGIARFLYNQYIAYNKKLYRMYQRGLLDNHQKHFVSANDFDKYINHNLKLNCRGLTNVVLKHERKRKSMPKQRSRSFSRAKPASQGSRRNLSKM